MPCSSSRGIHLLSFQAEFPFYWLRAPAGLLVLSEKRNDGYRLSFLCIKRRAVARGAARKPKGGEILCVSKFETRQWTKMRGRI
jgi:hypothetical protein